jgi:hypothetical protein
LWGVLPATHCVVVEGFFDGGRNEWPAKKVHQWSAVWSRRLPILPMTATTACNILRKSSATGKMFIANRFAVTAIAHRQRLHMEALDYHRCFSINTLVRPGWARLSNLVR